MGDTPSEIVMNLAKQKAGEIYEKMIEAKVGEQDSLVIGADTVVVKDGKVLGKPKNREDAFTMLKGLSGSSLYRSFALDAGGWKESTIQFL